MSPAPSVISRVRSHLASKGDCNSLPKNNLSGVHLVLSWVVVLKARQPRKFFILTCLGLVMKNLQCSVKSTVDSFHKWTLRIIQDGSCVGNSPTNTQIPYLLTAKYHGVVHPKEVGVTYKGKRVLSIFHTWLGTNFSRQVKQKNLEKLPTAPGSLRCLALSK